MTFLRRKPLHFGKIKKNLYKLNLLFFSINYGAACYVNEHGGVCLFCSKKIEQYDLRFARKKECWLFYVYFFELEETKSLSSSLIKIGADKIQIIPIKHLFELEEEFYE